MYAFDTLSKKDLKEKFGFTDALIEKYLKGEKCCFGEWYFYIVDSVMRQSDFKADFAKLQKRRDALARAWIKQKIESVTVAKVDIQNKVLEAHPQQYTIEEVGFDMKRGKAISKKTTKTNKKPTNRQLQEWGVQMLLDDYTDSLFVLHELFRRHTTVGIIHTLWDEYKCALLQKISEVYPEYAEECESRIAEMEES